MHAWAMTVMATEPETRAWQNRRVAEGLRVATPVVTIQFREPPPARTPERERWETECDRCRARPYEFNIPVPSRIKGKTFVLVVSLCEPCARFFGLNPADAEPPLKHRAVDDTIAVIKEHVLDDDAFTAAIGMSEDEYRTFDRDFDGETGEYRA